MGLRQDYERDGFLTAIDVVPPTTIKTYSQKCSKFIEMYSAHSSFSDWTYSKTDLILRWVAELASEEVLLDVIEELIGPNILLWNAFLAVKPPHSTANFGWHQDATYWPVSPMDQIATAWVALSPVNRFCGGMQMVQGSHLLGAIPHEETYDETSMLRRGQRALNPIDNNRVVNIELNPGQASIHHTLTLHGSGANESDMWRLGVGFNYVTSEVKPLPGYKDSATLLRGSAHGSGFVLTEKPKSDLNKAALDNYARIQQLQSKRYADVAKESS
jgi:ectoine hydroxylase-related dioxygenase (phytanoyl-CoA dioxygenase family)